MQFKLLRLRLVINRFQVELPG